MSDESQPIIQDTTIATPDVVVDPVVTPIVDPVVTPATAFENITNAINIMTGPLGITALASEVSASISKIVAASQNAPSTLTTVASTEAQRIMMLLVKHQVDNFKIFPDISKQITDIIAALSKSDYAGALSASQSLLAIAPLTSTSNITDVSSAIIANMMSNPLLTTNLNQVNDITDKINAALVDSEVIRFNDNMLRLSSALFPLLVLNKQA